MLQLPVEPAEAHRVGREVDAALGADGSLSAQIRETHTGEAARRESYERQRLGPENFTRRLVDLGL